MIYLSILLTAICLHGTAARRISDDMQDNEIENEPRGAELGKVTKDWVRISQQPAPVVSKLAGSRIELECEAVGSPAPQVQWLHGNTPVGKRPDFENNLINDIPSSGMAKVRSRLVIHIANANMHEGAYTCVAESGNQIASAKSKVYISKNRHNDINSTAQIVEQFLSIRTSAPLIVLYDTIYMDDIGSDIILPCKVIGYPQPSIMWLDPSESVIGDGADPRITVFPTGELSIRKIRWNDMGPYTCVARSSLGQDNVTTFLYPMLAEK